MVCVPSCRLSRYLNEGKREESTARLALLKENMLHNCLIYRSIPQATKKKIKKTWMDNTLYSQLIS